MHRQIFAQLIMCSALCAGGLFGATPPTTKASKTADKSSTQPNYGLFIDASFIYWYAAQDGMTIAYSGDNVDSLGTYPSPVVAFLSQPFEYSPGFKIGLGYGIKDWELHADYTWIRNNTSTSADASKNTTFGGSNIPVWVSTWFASGYISTSQISSSWKLSMDWLDVTAGQPYYQNKAVTVAPYGGVRALWIRQSLQVQEGLPLSGNGFPPGAISYSRTNCWGLGPVLGTSGRCSIQQGFTLDVNAGVSLLFTQYTTLYRKEENVSVNEDSPEANVTDLELKLENYNCVRPTANLGLGAGWETKLYNGAYQLSFQATYDFNVLWGQNMLHYVQDAYFIDSFSSNDLFLHGLTLTGRFDF